MGARLMGNAGAAQDDEEGAPDDVEVEAQGLAGEVLGVHADLFGDAEVVTAVDLGPAGEAGGEFVDAVLGAQFDEVVLVEERGAGADDAHVTLKDAPELGELVEGGPAEEGADGGEPGGGIVQQVRRDFGGVGAHGAELGHAEDAVVAADAVGPVDDWPKRSNFNRYGNNDHGDYQQRSS